MAYTLPHVGDTADEIFTTNLEGEKFQVRIRWNTRDEAWYIYIGYEGLPVTFTSKLNAGMNVLKGYEARVGTPNGAILLADTESLYGRPSRDNMGSSKRFKLLYLTQEEYKEVF